MDNLDILICQRIDEYNRKKEFISRAMKSKEESSHKWKRLRLSFGISVILAAACIMAIVFTMPFTGKNNIADMNIATPNFDLLRSGDSDLDKLIENEDYEQAIHITDSLVFEAKTEIEQLQNIDGTVETRYLTDLEQDYLNELLWSRIYLMVKSEIPDGLQQAIEEYLSQPGILTHSDEAAIIMKNLE